MKHPVAHMSRPKYYIHHLTIGSVSAQIDLRYEYAGHSLDLRSVSATCSFDVQIRRHWPRKIDVEHTKLQLFPDRVTAPFRLNFGFFLYMLVDVVVGGKE